MREGLVGDAIPFLLQELEADPGDSWLQWRIAWAYNQMELPDSALPYAGSAWESRPQEETFFSEYIKTLRRSGRIAEVLSLAGLIRGGGSARYHAAACGHEPSLAYLEESSSSPDDSTAADACCWLAVLDRSGGGGMRALGLLRRAVDLRPGESFYRSMLIEVLCESGLLEEAKDNLMVLRSMQCFDMPYWSSCAAVARLEGDTDRNLWALRRAVEIRRTPETERTLGWGLVTAARQDMLAGRLAHAGQRLDEALSLSLPEERFAIVADSLRAAIDDFE